MLKASGELVKKLKKQKRENNFLLFLDNPKIIFDAIKQGAKPILALTTKDKINDLNCETYLTSQTVIDSLSDVKTPQGVVVMLEYTQPVVTAPKNNFLVLDNLQDPGNVGTLIRSALAFGMECVFVVDGVKPTNSKVIRSSAGAVFNIPVYYLTKSEFINLSETNHFTLLKTDMEGENIHKFIFSNPVGIVIGNEGKGVSKEISKICSKTLTIPMEEGIESLNAGVCGSIVMYHIHSQKNK